MADVMGGRLLSPWVNVHAGFDSGMRNYHWIRRWVIGWLEKTHTFYVTDVTRKVLDCRIALVCVGVVIWVKL